jgi:hypothetical protein
MKIKKAAPRNNYEHYTFICCINSKNKIDITSSYLIINHINRKAVGENRF